MNFGGISQGIVQGLAANQQSDEARQLQQLRAMQIAQSQQQQAQQQAQAAQAAAQRQQIGQNMNIAGGMGGGQPPAPQPPMPGQASVPQQPPQQQPQSLPQGQGLFRGPMPPYQTVDGLAKQQPQSQPQGAQSGAMMPPSVGGNQTSSPPSVTPAQQLFSGPSALDTALTNMKKAGVPFDQQLQVLNDPAFKNYMSEQDKQRVEMLNAQKEARQAAKDAYDQTMREKEFGLREKQTNETIRHDQTSEGLQRQGLSIRQQSASGGAGMKEDATGDMGRVAMLIQGEPINTVVPGYGKQSAAMRERIQNKAIAQIMSDEGISALEAGKKLAQSQQEYRANQTALSAVTKRGAGIDVAINEIKNDIGTLKEIQSKYGSKDPTIVNRPINSIREKLSSPDLAALDIATNTVAKKYQKYLEGGALSIAQLHTGAAEDSKKLLSRDMSIAEINAKLPIMIREIENAERSNKAVTDKLSGRSSKSETKTISWDQLK
jgi:hypothetical protein